MRAGCLAAVGFLALLGAACGDEPQQHSGLSTVETAQGNTGLYRITAYDYLGECTVALAPGTVAGAAQQLVPRDSNPDGSLWIYGYVGVPNAGDQKSCAGVYWIELTPAE